MMFSAKLKREAYLGIIFVLWTLFALGMSQDRIITSSISLDEEDFDNATRENNIVSGNNFQFINRAYNLLTQRCFMYKLLFPEFYENVSTHFIF